MAMTPALTTALTTAPTTPPTTTTAPGRTSGRTAGAPGGACDRPCAGLCRPDGFAAAHRAHRPWLLTRLRALLGDRGVAEDAVQETFLRAWSACRSFDPTAGPSLATWIGTIGRNVAIDALRARSVRPRLTVEADESAERVCQSRPVDAALQRMVLLDALAGVSPEHRGVVLQAVVRDRPYADVAAALDIPVGTVKSRVHHALRGMRRTLDRTELAA
jgi:RNA polymerase sigma-70 factor (ECF subfamily)